MIFQRDLGYEPIAENAPVLDVVPPVSECFYLMSATNSWESFSRPYRQKLESRPQRLRTVVAEKGLVTRASPRDSEATGTRIGRRARSYDLPNFKA